MVTKRFFPAVTLLAATAMPALHQAGAPSTGDRLTIQAGPDGVRLDEFISVVSGVLDVPIFFNRRETSSRIVHFDGKVEVPRSEFIGFLERRLLEEGFVHLERTIGTVRTHEVVRLNPKRTENLELKTVAHRVDLTELAEMSDRQALVIMTWYCTNLPAEQVVAKIQDRFNSSKMEDVRHVARTNAIVMHAFAANLANMVTTIEQLGAHPAERVVVETSRERSAILRDAPVILGREPGGLRLSRVVDAVTQLVGEPIFYEGEPICFGADRVQDARVDFAGEIRLDRENALAWFDAILAQTGYARETRTVATRPLQVLWHIHHQAGRTEARHVMPEDLTAADGEFVSTAVALERIPSRQLVDSICCRFGGPNDDFVQALDGANAVVMSGAADKLAVYVALARELDRNATLEESKATDGPANK